MFEQYQKITDISKGICSIVNYKIGHKILTIEIKFLDINKTIKVVFSNVIYHEGATKWIGADFTEAQSQDLMEILNKLGHPYNSELSDDYKLFQTRGSRGLVQIVATKMNITT